MRLMQSCDSYSHVSVANNVIVGDTQLLLKQNGATGGFGMRHADQGTGHVCEHVLKLQLLSARMYAKEPLFRLKNRAYMYKGGGGGGRGGGGGGGVMAEGSGGNVGGPGAKPAYLQGVHDSAMSLHSWWYGSRPSWVSTAATSRVMTLQELTNVHSADAFFHSRLADSANQVKQQITTGSTRRQKAKFFENEKACNKWGAWGCRDEGGVRGGGGFRVGGGKGKAPWSALFVAPCTC